MSSAEAARAGAARIRGLGLARIPLEQVPGGDVVDVSLDGVGEEERLAQTDEPFVGVDEHEHEARELVQPEGVDARDPHAAS